jgi:chemosensory pili system protein ChpA (sensor histidine kinase/response regulator)
MAKFDVAELRDLFLLEAEEHIGTLARGISDLETAPAGEGLIEDLFRAAHTIKGAAALVKLNVISKIAHKMEDILEEIKDQKAQASSGVVELLLYMLDALTGLVRDVSEGREERPEVERQVLAKVEERGAKEREYPKVSEFVIRSASAPDACVPYGRRKEDYDFFSGKFVKVDVKKIDEMLNMIGEITIKKNRLLQETKGVGEVSDEIMFAGQRLNDEVNSFVERYAYSLPSQIKYLDPLFSDFGELEFDRYDEQNLFSRKLQEITDDMTEALRELSQVFEIFHDDVKWLDTMIRLLRSNISETRMVEIGRLLQRFVRPVKDLARQHGKEVALQISGGETHIDRVIFERLFDPLMHIVRNAISHGIEKPEERLLKGKKREGLITVFTKRDGATIVIEIRDDGNGPDTQRLFEEGLKRGIFKPDDTPTREELLGLIFMSGLSTRESADMTSGRGMGMSAVRKMIAALNGVIEIDYEVSAGTAFRIKVPSSLAITNVIIFQSGPIEFAVPISLVEEIIPCDIVSGGEGTPALARYRERTIPVKDLSEIFESGGGDAPQERFVLVFSISDKRIGLIVNDVLGQEETVIKPLNRFLEGLSLYSGITISGDGKVRFVINPVAVVEDHRKPLAVKGLTVAEGGRKRVLVVDDSLSVRKYVSTFLSGKEFRVWTASNGAEALKVLEDMPVDLIITDLEMPVMHGYELIGRLKSSEKLREIPIIVLTSRSTERHKEKAVEIGAGEYLVKPFEEDSLLSAVEKVLCSEPDLTEGVSACSDAAV